MSVYCGCSVLKGRGLCDELITLPEESYRLWRVVLCDLGNSWKRRPWHTGGCCAKNKQTNKHIVRLINMLCRCKCMLPVIYLGSYFVIARIDRSCWFLCLSVNYWPIPVPARFKAWVCGRSVAGTASSNPAWGMECSLMCVCCALAGGYHCEGPLTRPEKSYLVRCVWVWSWSFDKEVAQYC